MNIRDILIRGVGLLTIGLVEILYCISKPVIWLVLTWLMIKIRFEEIKIEMKYVFFLLFITIFFLFSIYKYKKSHEKDDLSIVTHTITKNYHNYNGHYYKSISYDREIYAFHNYSFKNWDDFIDNLDDMISEIVEINDYDFKDRIRSSKFKKHYLN